MTSRIDYNNPKNIGSLGLPYHYEMVSDSKRTAPFIQAIKKLAPGKLLFESGFGTGILGITGATHGAIHVYATDLDPEVLELARININSSNTIGKITLLPKDTLSIKLSDLDNKKPDIVIAENLSTWQVTEPQLEIWKYLMAEIAHPETVFLPQKIHNIFELASTQYTFESFINIRTYFFEFTGIRKPELLSDPVVFEEITPHNLIECKFSKRMDVEVRESGLLNSLRLQSPLTVYEDIKFDSSDSLMPPVIVPLENQQEVKAGQTISIQIDYLPGTSWEKFKARIV